jgi:hypothetical protein
MEDFQVYQDPPRANMFFSQVPSGGFRLVKIGSEVSISDVQPISGDAPGWNLIAMERGKDYSQEEARKLNSLLLLPVGRIDHQINIYHEYSNLDGIPLFTQFSKLDTDEDILQFAANYGQLINGVKFDNCGQLFLEPLQLWKNEISLVRKALTIWSSLEAREPVHQYLKPHVEKDKVLFLISGDYASCTVPLKAIQSETKRETVKRGLAQFLDQKMYEYPATVAHATEERKVRGKGTVRIPYRSFLRPTSLISAIWLQISQSFFKDGERDIIARRCFLTGDFFAESAMRQRNAEPFKGQYYSIRGMRNFQRQKNRRIEAAAEGKEVKPDRKGAMQFLVDFDAIGEPVAEVAKAQKKTHPKK